MPEPMRIGVLGLDHDHVWTVTEELARRGDAVLVAASVPDPELRAQAQRLRGVRVV